MPQQGRQRSGWQGAPTATLASTKWTRYGDLSAERDGGDPLGLRAAANRVGRRLSPALAQSSSFTRGFGLLTMALSLSSDEKSADELVKRFERFWVLAHVRRLEEGATSSFAGRRVAEQLLRHDPLDITVDLIQDQLSRGLWGAYRRPARLFGLIEMKDGARRDARPSTTRLTSSGRALASATRAAILGGQRKRLGAWLEIDRIPVAALDAVVDSGVAPSGDEVDELSDGMAQFDQGHRFPYSSLHQCWSELGREGSLTIRSLDGHLLNEDQRRALPLGLAIEELIQHVELPYREWMLGERSSIAASVAQAKEWTQLRDAGERDLVRLHDKLLPAKGRDGLLAAADEHQRWLAEARGSAAWERDLPNPSWANSALPDFGLSSPRNLFSEGVLAATSRDVTPEVSAIDFDVDDEDQAQ